MFDARKVFDRIPEQFDKWRPRYSEEDRLRRIRESERKSHIEMYSNDELYKQGSWLSKPVKTVLDVLPIFADY